MRVALIVTLGFAVVALSIGAWLPHEAPSTEASGTPGDHLPPLASPTPRVVAPLPASGSAHGALVAGYPVELGAPLPDSDTLDSSLATEGDILQFTLVARTDAAAEEVLARYDAQWASLGLVPAPETAGVLAYRDAFTSLTVSAATSGTGTVYTVFGVLKAG